MRVFPARVFLCEMALIGAYRLCTEVWARGRSQLRPWDLKLVVDEEDKDTTVSPQAGRPPIVASGSSASTVHGTHDKNAQFASEYGESRHSAAPSLPRFSFETRTHAGAKRPQGEAKPTMFGPERPILDPRIRKVHAQIVRDMLIVGVVWTAVWVVVVCAVPVRTRSRGW